MSAVSGERILAAIDATPVGADLGEVWAVIVAAVDAQVDELIGFLVDGEAEEWCAARAERVVAGPPALWLWAAAALRVRAARDHGHPLEMPDAIPAEIASAEDQAQAERMRAWAENGDTHPQLDTALTALLMEGSFLMHACDIVALACWSRERADLVTRIAQRLVEIAGRVGPTGARWENIDAWARDIGEGPYRHDILAKLRAAPLPIDEDTAAALILSRAGFAAGRILRDHYTTTLTEELSQNLSLHAPISASGSFGRYPTTLIDIPPLCRHERVALTEHIFLAAGARERLERARQEMSVEDDARQRRNRYWWERKLHYRLTFAYESGAESVSEFSTRARRWLWDPELAGADTATAAGRSLFVPVNRATIAELVATHRGAAHCEGLRLVRSVGQRGTHDGPRCHLALTLAHADDTHSTRCLHAVWDAVDGEEWGMHSAWNEDAALALVAELGVPATELAPDIGWDDTQSWFGMHLSPRATPTDVLHLNHCTHARWEWDMDADAADEQQSLRDIAEARCRYCQRPMRRAHPWQLDPPVAIHPLKRALRRAHWWVALAGGDADAIPDTLEALRAWDETVPQQPRTQRAPRGTAQNLRRTLGGGR